MGRIKIQAVGGVREILAICFLAAASLSSSLVSAGSSQSHVSLDAIQGAWWSSCADPAAVFLISQDWYSGDFSGRYNLTLTAGVLTFANGLPEGHSINVAGRPQSFLVMRVSPSELVLRPMDRIREPDWHLHSCQGMPPNNAFEPTPLRGAA